MTLLTLLILSGMSAGQEVARAAGASCALELGGEAHQALKLTNTTDTVLVTVTGAGRCGLRVLAVGCGGWGHSAGAGSGYIQYQTLSLVAGAGVETVISARVGEGGTHNGDSVYTPSFVTVRGETDTTIVAECGQGLSDNVETLNGY